LCGAPHKAKDGLFVGSEFTGQQAAVMMSLVQSAKLNGRDPWPYLRDALARLPTLTSSDLRVSGATGSDV